MQIKLGLREEWLGEWDEGEAERTFLSLSEVS